MPELLYFITLLEWIYLAYLSGDAIKGFWLFLVMHLAYGFAFGKTVICQHRQPKLWSAGAP